MPAHPGRVSAEHMPYLKKSITYKTDLLLLAGIFALSLMWVYLYSLQGHPAESMPIFDIKPLQYAVIAVLLAIIVFIAQSAPRAAYFFGASPAIGLIPPIPHLATFIEFSHLAIFALLYALWRASGRLQVRKLSPSLTLYLIFLAIATFSIILNFTLHHDVWQFKMGVLSFILSACFGACFFLIENVSEDISKLADHMLKGFMHGTAFISALGVIVMIIMLSISYAPNMSDNCDGTIYGLGYCDRMQLMFRGPVVAGIYFAIAIPLTVCWIQKNPPGKTSLWTFMLQVLPWLIMATGSRTAKAAIAIIMITSFINKPTRKITLFMLPSALMAFLICASSQSFPDAMHIFFGNLCNAINILHNNIIINHLYGHYFQDQRRELLLLSTIDFFMNSPLINKLFGNGYGVGGYSASIYPSPHSQLGNLLVDVGIIGFVMYYWFIMRVVLETLRLANKQPNLPANNMLALLLSIVCLFLYSFTYGIRDQGVLWVVLLLIFLYTKQRKT